MTDLERARRECLDRIRGNVPFHDDPFAAPKAKPDPARDGPCYAAHIGVAECVCAECRAERGDA